MNNITDEKATKFIVGRTYWDRHAGDHDLVSTFTVISRTPKFITIQEAGEKKPVRRGVYLYDGVEHCKPHGDYSMCMIISAKNYQSDEQPSTTSKDGAANTKQLIAEAIKPLREVAERYAEESARGMVLRVVGWLHEHDADMDKIAPYGGAADRSRAEYEAIRAKRALVNALCDHTYGSPLSRTIGKPSIMVLNPTKIVEFVKRARVQAGLDFEAYTEKLAFKNGDSIRAARLGGVRAHGGNPWYESYLIVTLANGNEVIWKTQMIYNTSVLGKHFNQFPTRIVKKVGD